MQKIFSTLKRIEPIGIFSIILFLILALGATWAIHHDGDLFTPAGIGGAFVFWGFFFSITGIVYSTAPKKIYKNRMTWGQLTISLLMELFLGLLGSGGGRLLAGGSSSSGGKFSGGGGSSGGGGASGHW